LIRCYFKKELCSDLMETVVITTQRGVLIDDDDERSTNQRKMSSQTKSRMKAIKF